MTWKQQCILEGGLFAISGKNLPKLELNLQQVKYIFQQEKFVNGPYRYKRLKHHNVGCNQSVSGVTMIRCPTLLPRTLNPTAISIQASSNNHTQTEHEQKCYILHFWSFYLIICIIIGWVYNVIATGSRFVPLFI